MNPGPTTPSCWRAVLLALLLGSGPMTLANSRSASVALPARAASGAITAERMLAEGRVGRLAERRDLDAAASRRPAGTGVRSPRPLEADAGVAVLAPGRDSLLRGWPSSAGSRQAPAGERGSAEGPARWILDVLEWTRASTESGSPSPSGGLAEDLATFASSGDVQRGDRNREPTPASRSAVPRDGSVGRRNPGAGSSLPSPWTTRPDLAGKESQELGSNGERVEGLARWNSGSSASAPRDSRAAELGAPLGFEGLEFAFGEGALVLQPFVAARRQSDEATASAFGRAVLGMAGVQFDAGEAWDCRVQVSQAFVDDLGERTEQPAFSIALRRRF